MAAYRRGGADGERRSGHGRARRWRFRRAAGSRCQGAAGRVSALRLGDDAVGRVRVYPDRHVRARKMRISMRIGWSTWR